MTTDRRLEGLQANKEYLHVPASTDDLRADFIEALAEVSSLMRRAYEQLGPVPQEHVLAQAGLEQGHAIVLDYLEHNEAGIAFDHLLYMINEPPLMVSAHCMNVLARIARHLGRALA